SRGTTRTWPRNSGRASRKPMSGGSSRTRCAGAAPAAIRQKTHDGMPRIILGTMPRPLVLRKDGVELPFQLVKLDRSKLYGTVEVEALDGQGRRCELATLATDGKTLLGRGDVASGFLTPEGGWLDRASLKPVGPDGEPVAPLPSSFAAPTDLADEATVEEYLAHNVKSVYHVT